MQKYYFTKQALKDQNAIVYFQCFLPVLAKIVRSF